MDGLCANTKLLLSTRILKLFQGLNIPPGRITVGFPVQRFAAQKEIGSGSHSLTGAIIRTACTFMASTLDRWTVCPGRVREGQCSHRIALRMSLMPSHLVCISITVMCFH